MTEDELKQIDTVLTILSAHQRDVVKAALKRRNAHMRGERIAAGWQIYTAQGEPPTTAGDRMRIGSLWYVRERRSAPERPLPAAPSIATSEKASANAQRGTRNRQPATDLSMQPTDRQCPVCGEMMAWEPICPGCALGRMGFRGRYVCMDDFDHTFYVTKPGLELPNR